MKILTWQKIEVRQKHDTQKPIHFKTIFRKTVTWRCKPRNYIISDYKNSSLRWIKSWDEEGMYEDCVHSIHNQTVDAVWAPVCIFLHLTFNNNSTHFFTHLMYFILANNLLTSIDWQIVHRARFMSVKNSQCEQ